MPIACLWPTQEDVWYFKKFLAEQVCFCVLLFPVNFCLFSWLLVTLHNFSFVLQGGLSDVSLWANVEAFKAIPASKPKASAARAKAIYRCYKSSHAFPADATDASRTEHYAPSFEMFEEVQLVAEERIAAQWLPM